MIRQVNMIRKINFSISIQNYCHLKESSLNIIDDIMLSFMILVCNKVSPYKEYNFIYKQFIEIAVKFWTLLGLM